MTLVERVNEAGGKGIFLVAWCFQRPAVGSNELFYSA